MTKNYKLDATANLFPLVSDQNNSAVFRLSVVLKQEIDPHYLQLATNLIYERYSHLFLRLRRGLFWNYFDQNPLHFTVAPETHPPCQAINAYENRGYKLKILYYHQRLSVEVFHSLSDGTGVLEFLKSLTYYYLTLKYGDFPHQGKILLFDQKNLNQNDSLTQYFAQNSSKPPKINHKQANAYQIRGQYYPFHGNQVNTGLISVAKLKSLAKKNHTTITTYLASHLAYSINQSSNQQLHNKKESQPIVIAIPVNLRKLFPSQTLKNFFEVINLSYTFSQKSTLKSVINNFAQQLSEFTKQSQLTTLTQERLRLSNNFISKNTPLIVKKSLMPLIFNQLAQRKKTLTLTNLGQFDFPDSGQKYLSHVEVLLYPTKKSPLGAAVISYQDQLSINFTSSIKENKIVPNFFHNLTQALGQKIPIYSNHYGQKKPQKLQSTSYPNYQKTLRPVPASQKLPLFLAFVIIIIVSYINFFTYHNARNFWGIIVSAAVLYAIIIHRLIINPSQKLASKIIYFYLSTSLLLFIVDLCSGRHLWSSNYVSPFFNLALVIILALLTIRSKKNFIEYFGYLLLSVTLGFIPIILYLFGLATTLWTTLLAVLTGLIIIIALYLLTDSDLKQEIKKRFAR